MRGGVGASLLLVTALTAQEPRPEDHRAQPREAAVFLTEVPAHPGSVVLARPTATTLTVSLLWHAGAEATLVWGPADAALPAKGRPVTLRPGEPTPVVMEGLKADTAYAYELRDAATGKRLLPVEGPGAFHTARPRGKAFTFTLQADSHLDGSCLPELYQRTLANARADRPDFHLDLGDTFMTEKHPSRESAARQYMAQRYHLGRLAEVAPLFLVLGNHDGETLDRSGRTPTDGLALWAHGQRTRLFPNPVPDGFYTGNGLRHPQAGLLQNFYAWEWGDALFVALDPYWTSMPTKGGREPWNMTLGPDQYAWLERTLKGSRAPFKFVFLHQLTGSYHPAGRGGAEAAAYQEWGGHDLDGTEAFAAHRAGWAQPIHRLFVATGVTAVFHGHDHFYAKQALDGIAYQLVPQPAHRNDRSHHAEEYGYKEGTFLPSSGHLRVEVTPTAATVSYVRAALPEMARRGAANGTVADRYELRPRPVN